jgi:hypothetical protein
MISALQQGGASVGVYASHAMWSQIAGDSCTVGSSLPLWYPHYDGVASCSDMTPFGGWTPSSVYAKQYRGDARSCGVGVDMN